MRTQVAVFVDAGYLFALGSISIAGQTSKRERIGIKSDVFLTEIKSLVRQLTGAKPLLRVYWYETSTSNRVLGTEHVHIGQTNEIKLRIVPLHQHNFRTAVTSAIARDLAELGRNGAISDALVLARNDALRTGVEFSQSYGVRVHMLEIFAEQDSEFSALCSEADTNTAWRRVDVEKFLFEQDLATIVDYDTTLRSYQKPPPTDRSMSVEPSYEPQQLAREIPDETRDAIHNVVIEYIEQLYDEELEACMGYWRNGRGVPNSYDKSLLFECRNALERNLTEDERVVMRSSFREFVIERVQGDGDDQSTSRQDEDLL